MGSHGMRVRRNYRRSDSPASAPVQFWPNAGKTPRPEIVASSGTHPLFLVSFYSRAQSRRYLHWLGRSVIFASNLVLMIMVLTAPPGLKYMMVR